MKKKQSRPVASAAASATTEGAQLSLGRKILFSIVGFVLLPVLALVFLEVILRVAGVGYDPSFLKPITIQGEKYFVENDRFGLRFFPPEMARSPAPMVFKAKKEPGVTRIFVIGESAALGDPRPSYSAGRYLQALLRERFPESQFEVIAAAVTAINSHALVPIARECARRDGDLWILYMGNNEMVGPFGATTVLGSQAPPLLYIRFSLAVQSTRLGQLIMAAGRKLAGRAPREGGWGGMQMWVENRVPPQDARKQVVYRNFKRNLESILNTGARANIPVIYSTVCVNLRDCAPFASVQGYESESQKQQFQELLAQASKAEDAGDLPSAKELYAVAVEMDPQYADARFRLGGLCLNLQAIEEARTHFSAARDADALPFRTDKRLNTILRETQARRGGSKREVFVDADVALATHANHGIPGHELFYEHVHFNFDGNYALARLWADEVARFLNGEAKKGDTGAWASQEQCERRLGLTDWNRHEVMAEVLTRLGQAPFTHQSNHELQVTAVRKELRELRAQVTNQSVADARKVYVGALENSPRDHRLHENFAEFLELTGSLSEATEQWEEVRRIIPHHHSGHFHTGRLFMKRGNLAEAETRLRTALQLRPDLAEAWLVLGQVFALRKDPKAAIENYREAQKLASTDPRIYYHLGQALSKLGHRAEAVESFKLAVRLHPTFWEARYALGEELAFSGKPVEARAEFEQVLQINPTYPMAHFNLGVALIELKQFERALHHLEQAHKLDPTNQQAASYAKKLRERLNRL